MKDNAFQINLKALRESAELSQAAFARIFGIAQSTVGMWESGKREPNFETTQKLATYFNVSVDYLLGREQKEKPTSEDMSFEQFSEVLHEKGLTDNDFKSLNKEQLSAIAEIIKNFKK